MARRRLPSLLLLLLIAALAAAWAPVWARRALEGRLGALFARPATVGNVGLRLFPLRVEVRDVRVAGAVAGAAPFLEVRRAVAQPSLLPAWRGLRLRQLRLSGLRVRVQAYESGGDDLPRLDLPGGSGEARIGRLLVEDAELLVDHRRVPLEMDLPSVHGALRADAGGALSGRFSFGAGTVRFAERPPLRLASEVQVSLRAGRLEVASARLQTEKTDLALRGALALSPSLRGEFTMAGPVDLAVLDQHVMDSGFGLRGHAEYAGRVRVDGSRLELDGRLEGRDGEFDGVPVPRYAGDVSWKEGRLQARGLDLEALQGSGRIDIDLPPAPGTVRLRAALRDMDAEGLGRLVFDLGEAGIGAGASGDVDLRWPRGHNRALTGTAELQFVARADGRTPLWGRFAWRAADGRQQVEEAELRTPAGRALLSGRIEPDRSVELAIDAESADLAAMDELLLRVRRALHTEAPRPAELGGTGGFRGHWRGTLEQPVFEGRFEGERLSYLGVDWGRAEWTGALTPSELRSHALVVRRGEGELSLEGMQRTGPYGEDDALRLDVRLRRWPASDLARALRLDLPLDALLSGEASLRGRRSRLDGELSLRSDEGSYAGVPYRDLSVRSLLGEGMARVREGWARLGGGSLRFHGSLSEDGVYDAAAQLEDVELSELAPSLSPAVRPGGRVSGALLVQGPLERPRLQARLRARRLFLGDEGIGALEASFNGGGDGRIQVQATCRSARVDLQAMGEVGAAAPHPATLRISARETSLDPFLRARRPELPAGVPLVATGEVELSGPLQRPRELDVRARVSDLQLLVPDYPVKTLAPLAVRFAEGRLELGRLHLGGEGTDLVVSGSVPVLDAGPLAVEARGSADLRMLSLLNQELRGRGTARLAMSVAGARQSPRLEGSMEVRDGALRVRRFPHGIEELQGTVRFTHEGAQLEGGQGQVGGAPVRLRGQAAWARGAAVSFDVQAAGEGIAVRYPEGLRSLVDADLRLFGDQKAQWLTGQVNVRQAVWSQRYDVASELLAERHRLEAAPVLEGGLRYDVKVSAPGTLKVDNNLATLQARADLALQGTYTAPVVLGRAEVDRGRVYFQGNTYLIRRGSIDFANPRRTDPLFDIEAETRIHSYRITLRVNGTLERVYPTLASDPYLSQVAILGLLAGADEGTVASLDTRRDEAHTRLAVTGAATLAAGRISEEMGLERGAQRLFGLSRFSIDPSAVRGDVTNPTARLTVGKRLTPEMTILYSTDLRGTEERLVSMEYTVSERVSLLLTRAEPGGFGFDLRLRQSR